MAVQFKRIDGFDQLPPIQAECLIDEMLLKACDKEGIVLSKYGNLALNGEAAHCSHQQLKGKGLFFNVEHVQTAYKIVMSIDTSEGKKPRSGVLKERVKAQVKNILEGELAVAVLFRGHVADFHKSKTMTFDIKWK